MRQRIFVAILFLLHMFNRWFMFIILSIWYYKLDIKIKVSFRTQYIRQVVDYTHTHVIPYVFTRDVHSAAIDFHTQLRCLIDFNVMNDCFNRNEGAVLKLHTKHHSILIDTLIVERTEGMVYNRRKTWIEIKII
jgi:hypothetical protein